MSDVELLQAYSRHASEEAFRTLVVRYADFVYSTALRQVRNIQLAEEISQIVFTLLAKKAAALNDVGNLAGWLHRATCLTALKTIRSESRRRHREQLAIVMNEPASICDADEVFVSLDQAIDQLSESDRIAILARFIQRKTIAEVASVLQISDHAAKKRIARAIEKLRTILNRRNVAISSVTLGMLLLNVPSQAAPPFLALKMASASLGAAPKVSFLKLLMTVKTKLAIAICLLTLCGIIVVNWNRGIKHVVNSTGTNGPISEMFEKADRDIPTVATRMPVSDVRETDFNALIDQLNAALREPSESDMILNDATIDAVRRFGVHHEKVFQVLTNASALPERLIFSRAIEALSLLDRSTPGLLPFLWQTAGGGDDRAFYAITPLCNLGLEPQDIPKLARLLTIPYLNAQIDHACELAIKADPEAAKSYLPSIEQFLSHENTDTRFYAACILAWAGYCDNPQVIAEIMGALDPTDPSRFGRGLRALASAGSIAKAAIPDLLKLLNQWNPALVEDPTVLDLNAPQKLLDQLLRTIGSIDPTMRAMIPDVDDVMKEDEQAAEFRETVERGGSSVADLIAALDEPAKQGSAVFHLRDAGPAATDALPKLLDILSSTYEKSRKDDIEAAIKAINPQITRRHIDSTHLADALDEAQLAIKPKTEVERSPLKELSKRYYGLINYFTWYTEDNLRDLSRQIAAINPEAHEVFKRKLLSSDPSVGGLLQ